MGKCEMLDSDGERASVMGSGGITITRIRYNQTVHPSCVFYHRYYSVL